MATPTLDYDRAPAAVPMIWLHRIALVCALVPMAVGVLAFVLYVATRHLDFAILGFFTLLGGCALTFVGGVCLGVYRFQASRAAPDEAARARRRANRDLLILLANFPLGAVLAVIGVIMLNHQDSSVSIAVTNQDTVVADRVMLDTAGGELQLGPIAPGATARGRIDFGSRGLDATLVRGGVETPTTQILNTMDADTVSSRHDLRLVIRNGQIVLPE